MPTAPVAALEPLAPLIGRWRTSGSILDADGAVTGAISGTDAYAWLPGGTWLVHEVDVAMDGETTRALELIGGWDDAVGGWRTYAFGPGDEPEVMRLTQPEAGVLLLSGDGVRSWLRPGPDRMTARWERAVDGGWVGWLDMRFDREG